jgi:cytochrome c oxidase assembly protein subunit 15
MTNPAPYDFAPLAGLLLVGVLLALGPVLWAHWRHPGAGPQQRLRTLRILTLWLTFDLILFGAFTRLTDSGLGCPDWPGCYGSTTPWAASASISAAQAALPTGPVTHGKAWVEMIHRYLATAVGALITAMTVMTWWPHWRARTSAEVRRQQDLSPWWVTVSLVWVCLQGAFGAWTVTWKLFPAIVSLHLAGAMVLLALLAVQAVRGDSAKPRVPMPQPLRQTTRLVLVLLALQVMLGAWVSTNYAVLACRDFPMCQGTWWPPMNFSQGFELWRHLGVTAQGLPIDFSALTAIHYMHRLMAYLVLSAMMVLAWQLNQHHAWRSGARVLALLLGLQLATGLSNVLLDWPLFSALLHSGGAAALVLHLTSLLARSSSPSAKALGVAQVVQPSGRRSLA